MDDLRKLAENASSEKAEAYRTAMNLRKQVRMYSYNFTALVFLYSKESTVIDYLRHE